jgi:hypothetical protein
MSKTLSDVEVNLISKVGINLHQEDFITSHIINEVINTKINHTLDALNNNNRSPVTTGSVEYNLRRR